MNAPLYDYLGATLDRVIGERAVDPPEPSNAELLALGAYTGYRVVHSVSAAVATYAARVHV